VCRKPRPFDLVKESRTVGHDGCAAPLPFEAVGFAVQADQPACWWVVAPQLGIPLARALSRRSSTPLSARWYSY
jgi:hypothetical protein